MKVNCGFCGSENDVQDLENHSSFVCKMCSRENDLEELKHQQVKDPKVYMKFFEKKEKFLKLGSTIILLLFMAGFLIDVWSWVLRYYTSNLLFPLAGVLVSFPVVYLCIFSIHYVTACKGGDVELLDMMLSVLIWIEKTLFQFVPYTFAIFIGCLIAFLILVIVVGFVNNYWGQKKIFDGIPSIPLEPRQKRKITLILILNYIVMIILAGIGIWLYLSYMPVGFI